MSVQGKRGSDAGRADAGAPMVVLNAEQTRVLERLRSRATLHLDELAKISAERVNAEGECPGNAAPSSAFKQLKTPRQSNCLGVFGRRGSGKTTVMVSVLKRIADDHTCWHTVLQPMDLSYAPHEFPHGLTVIHWLYETLRMNPRGCSGDASAHKAFDRMARSYFRGSDGFNALVRDLAVSAEHYATAAAKEISLRLNLRREIQCWLDAQARALEVDGFVIAIDDVDLTPANRHQSLIWSLLDELHQDRLFFVLAADLGRMEQRLAEEDQFTRHDADGAAGGDAAASRQAARDLAYKVLPQVDRAELAPWSPAARVGFPPSEQDTIGELSKALQLRPILLGHLQHLLPEWARGLENVQRELLQLRQDREAAIAAKKVLDAERIERDLLVSLAESSFDFDLARKLRERPLPEWAPTFHWNPPSASLSATWDVLRQRLHVGEDLPELLPDPATCPLKISLERARWAEVLLDVAMDAGRLEPVRLVNRVPWLQARLNESEVDLQRTADSVDCAVQDDPAGMLAALYWLRWPDARRRRSGWFALGLWPVLQLLAGDRRLWPSVASREIWTPELLARDARKAIRGDAASASAAARLDVLARGQGDVADGALLPRRVRDLLCVSDVLARQPWTALGSVGAEIGPPGLARLAAALTYYGLRSMVADPKLPAADWLTPLVRPLQGEAGEVGALDEVTIRDGFIAIDSAASADREALSNNADPLATALLALLDAPWFRGLAV